jgi:hypothetical protein
MSLTVLESTQEDSRILTMKSGVEYSLSLWKSLYAANSKIRLTAPVGWKFFIAEDGSSDLIERESYLLSVSNVTTDLTIKLLPEGASLSSLRTGRPDRFPTKGSSGRSVLGV